MRLRWKLKSEIYRKVENLGGKMTQNRLKMCTFPFFFLKILLFSKKKRKKKRKMLFINIIIIVKIEIFANFMCLNLKMTSEICHKIASLDLKTAFFFFFEQKMI